MAKQVKVAQKMVTPPPFSAAAYRVSIRSPDDLRDSAIWPIPAGQWRVVQLDTNGVRIARPAEANEPFYALPKGVVRGGTSQTWADYAKAIKAAFADPSRGLREWVFISTGDYGDVLAPPTAAPLQTLQPTPAEVAARKATATKLGVPAASSMTAADFAAASEGDFESGEDVEDSNMMPLLILGAGALAALLIMQRGE